MFNGLEVLSKIDGSCGQISNSYDEKALSLLIKKKIAGGVGPPLPTNGASKLTRVSYIDFATGVGGRGSINAQWDIDPNAHVFKGHFESFPVLPASEAEEAARQAVGFWTMMYDGSSKNTSKEWVNTPRIGCFLGCGGVSVTHPITPDVGTLYVDVRVSSVRFRSGRLLVVTANADMSVVLRGKIVPCISVKDIKIRVMPRAKLEA